MARGSLRKRPKTRVENDNELQRNQRDDRDRRPRKDEPINWLTLLILGGLLVGGGGTLFLQAGKGFMRFLEPTYEVVDARDTNILQEIFYKGEPWVVFCGRKTHDGRVNSTYQGRSSLWGVQLMDKLAVHANGRFRVGLLDCSAYLPSGKTIFERFRLKPNKASSQMAFWVANGGSPRMIDAYSLRSAVDYDVARLATKIGKWTEVKEMPISNTKQLTKKCIEYKRGCVVIVNKGPSLQLHLKDELNKVMKKHRKFRYFVLDKTKRKISLTLPPATMGYPQIVLIKKTSVGEGIDRYYEYKYSIFDDEFEEKEISKFLGESEGKGAEDSFWSSLEPLPTISKIISKSETPKKKKPTKQKRTAPPASQQRKEQARKARVEKESARKQSKGDEPKETDEEMHKRRRRQMDEDMRGNAPQAHDEDSEDMEFEELEEDEEFIDLDI